MVMILNGKLQRTDDITVNNPVPRGKMYDRNGKVIVDNTAAKRNYIYQIPKMQIQKEMLKVAETTCEID